MRHVGSLVGGAALLRRFKIGATVVKGQLVCVDNGNNYGEVGAPASVTDYTEAVGVTTEAGTATTTQGTGASSADVLVEVQYGPWAIYRGRCSGGDTSDTALDTSTDGNLLTNTSASTAGTVITSANVGTSSFASGIMVALVGANAGQARTITSHSDNTSETVRAPFDNTIAVGDTFLRAFGFGNQGLELTTNYTQFVMKIEAGVNLSDTGNGIVQNIVIDGNPPGKRDGRYLIVNPTAPYVEVDIILSDSVFNSLA